MHHTVALRDMVKPVAPVQGPRVFQSASWPAEVWRSNPTRHNGRLAPFDCDYSIESIGSTRIMFTPTLFQNPA
jgi:hypothetical protein